MNPHLSLVDLFAGKVIRDFGALDQISENLVFPRTESNWLKWISKQVRPVGCQHWATTKLHPIRPASTSKPSAAQPNVLESQ